ncbi:MAG: sugar ABC transporter permease [Treponema sp. GWB1_62_6]|nr:MAG: sugar ABC transporter permease [Treponema sp. GWB1_62_6]OHE69742.1 MAG: sugar ABC transporter permease [Treponema sp. GWC1_61_84]OHE76647.1 MAG: sugar ABC transporter permease [Treponema sp. RIFOXYC1_FULL_61_9]HCM26757.1 ABC transporter permease [Treponema sp.]
MDELIVTVLYRSLVFATPLFIGTLGEILTERAGVLNLGMEGLVAFGAFAGFAATAASGSAWIGILGALAGGALLASIHAFVSVTLRANQVVSGLALTMIGTGAAGMWGKPFVGKAAAERLGPVDFGFLSDLPVVGRVLFSQDPFFYLGLIAGAMLWFFLEHTKAGLRVRAVGENPKAADSLGVRVGLVKWLCVMAGGALAALAGAQLSLSYSASWTESMSGGRGWIVIALTIFALWNPVRAFWGSLLFGGIFVLQYLLQPLGVPPSILGMLPYLATLTALALEGLRKDTRSLFAPAMLGEAYKRGER